MTNQDGKSIHAEGPTPGVQRPTESTDRENRDRQAPPSPPPPRGPSGKVILALVIVAGVMLWVGTRWGDQLSAGAEQVVERVTAEPDEQEGTESATTGQYYTCGMHPWVILPKPGDCPICHMELTPLDPDKFTGEITIDPVVLQNIGVRVASVTSGAVTKAIRTVGTVDYNETAVRDVNLKLAGWIEDLYVNYLGEEVEKGQRLFELYAPELYAAQQEYLLALRGASERNTLSRSGIAGRDNGAATQAADDVLAATRTRLEYYDISDEQIRELEQRGEPAKTMTIHSPHEGVVIEKNAYEGMHVQPGTQLYRIADLSTVWVMVTLYEYQLPYVHVGQEAVMSLPYIPGQTFEGKVIYIYPTLDEKTRQVRVRLEFANPQGLLKPGMYVEVELRSTLAKDRVLAPRDAVIDTGTRKVAFVSLGEGKFEPREVRTGVRTGDDMVQVLDGLAPGEKVVVSGQFLIDSEAKIRASLARMIKGDLASEQEVQAEVAGQSELESLPGAASEAIGRMLDSYFAIGDALASDEVDGISIQARQLAQAADRLVDVEIPGRPHFWHEHDEVATIGGAAMKIAKVADPNEGGPEEALVEARLGFADLSVAMETLIGATGVPPGYDRQVVNLHCPMFRDSQGGSVWLQPAGEVRNPFYGQVMLGCFDERHAMPVTGQSAGDAGAGEDRESDNTGDVGAAEADGTMAGGDAAEHAGHAMSSGVDPQVRGQVDALVRAYLEVHQALAADDPEAAKRAAGRVVEAGEVLPAEVAGARQVVEAAEQMRAADGAGAIRAVFEGLSAATLEVVRAASPTAGAADSLYRAYCPMVDKSWLQEGEAIENPYDPGMLRCGVLKGEDLIGGTATE